MPGLRRLPAAVDLILSFRTAWPAPTGQAPPLVGGVGTLNTPNPVRTVGSYWPFPTSIWDFINRAMPLGQAGTLPADEVYALTAFLLYKNGVIPESDTPHA